MLKINLTKTYLTLLPIFFLFGILSYAQEDLNDKIKAIDDDVNKVTISSGGEEYTFEGDDAKTLFKKMKSGLSGSHSFIWQTDGDEIENHDGKLIFIDENGNKKVIEIDEDDGDNINVFISKDIDISEQDQLEKKIEVEVKDGNKKVTVTTKENGEEKTEVYEGEEADEYLEKMKSEHGDDINIEFDNDGNHKKMKKIIIETEVEEDKDND